MKGGDIAICKRPLLVRGTKTDTRPYMIGNSQGLKIGRRTPERRMIVLRRHVFLQSIKDLFSMIQTQGVVHFLSGIETCGFVEGEVMAMVCGWC